MAVAWFLWHKGNHGEEQGFELWYSSSGTIVVASRVQEITIQGGGVLRMHYNAVLACQ